MTASRLVLAVVVVALILVGKALVVHETTQAAFTPAPAPHPFAAGMRTLAPPSLRPHVDRATRSDHRAQIRHRSSSKPAPIRHHSAAPTLTPTPAAAATAPVGVWDRLAACESAGDWSIDTGNGFYGGLQFTTTTWAGFGGLAYAARADLASRTAQIAVARLVQAAQGWGAWPVCARKIGLR